MRWFAVMVVAGCGIDESGLLLPDAGPSDAATIDVHGDMDAASDTFVGDAPAQDATPDVLPPPPDCNATNKPFGAPSALMLAAIDTNSELSPALTDDELTIYFTRSASATSYTLYYAQRSSTLVPFNAATQLTTTLAGSAGYDFTPHEVDPFATLYFGSYRTTTNSRVYTAKGDGVHPDMWTGIARVTAVSGATASDNDTSPAWCAATSELWFASDRVGAGGGLNLWTSAGGTGTPTAVASVNSGADEIDPALSADGMTVYFGRGNLKANPFPTASIFVAKRASKTAAFSVPTAVAELNSSGGFNAPGWLPVDGCRIYFTSDRSGSGPDIFMASRVP